VNGTNRGEREADGEELTKKRHQKGIAVRAKKKEWALREGRELRGRKRRRGKIGFTVKGGGNERHSKLHLMEKGVQARRGFESGKGGEAILCAGDTARKTRGNRWGFFETEGRGQATREGWGGGSKTNRRRRRVMKGNRVPRHKKD